MVRWEGTRGKTVSLNAVVQNGSLRDVMMLGVRSQPPLTGRIGFRTKIVIPPGDRAIADKLVLNGRFDIRSGKFTSEATQQKIASLSGKAQGRPRAEPDGDVLTNLGGGFALQDAILKLAGLTFSVPGADIRLDGTYGIETERLDFQGTATTQAKVSQMTTGVKSIFLKVVDPFFKKNGSGAVIPIRIGGTRDQPTFGLRLRG